MFAIGNVYVSTENQLLSVLLQSQVRDEDSASGSDNENMPSTTQALSKTIKELFVKMFGRTLNYLRNVIDNFAIHVTSGTGQVHIDSDLGNKFTNRGRKSILLVSYWFAAITSILLVERAFPNYNRKRLIRACQYLMWKFHFCHEFDFCVEPNTYSSLLFHLFCALYRLVSQRLYVEYVDHRHATDNCITHTNIFCIRSDPEFVPREHQTPEQFLLSQFPPQVKEENVSQPKEEKDATGTANLDIKIPEIVMSDARPSPSSWTSCVIGPRVVIEHPDAFARCHFEHGDPTEMIKRQLGPDFVCEDPGNRKRLVTLSCHGYYRR